VQLFQEATTVALRPAVSRRFIARRAVTDLAPLVHQSIEVASHAVANEEDGTDLGELR
jgi:hypothetical protein